MTLLISIIQPLIGSLAGSLAGALTSLVISLVTSLVGLVGAVVHTDDSGGGFWMRSSRPKTSGTQ